MQKHNRKAIFQTITPTLETRLGQRHLTEKVRQGLPDLLAELEIKNIVDAPCGDRDWMKILDYRFESYLGVDIEECIINKLQTENFSTSVSFQVGDLTTEVLPTADAVLCRDFLVHLPFEMIWNVLKYFKLAGFKYLITTTFPTRNSNADIGVGDWRPLNLQVYPFYFSEPLYVISDSNHEIAAHYDDKSLAVWKITDIPIKSEPKPQLRLQPKSDYSNYIISTTDQYVTKTEEQTDKYLEVFNLIREVVLIIDHAKKQQVFNNWQTFEYTVDDIRNSLADFMRALSIHPAATKYPLEDFKNAIKIIDYAADQGVFKGWIDEAKIIRNKLNDEIELHNEKIEIKNKTNYLKMQQTQYETESAKWSQHNRDAVVGNYDAHNMWKDYDTLLFKNFDTTKLIALEYGCGPGRNIIRFAKRFARIDGIDIAQNNLNAAVDNLTHHHIPVPNLYHNDGSSMPMIQSNTYDVVFSVICLQHIACYDVRSSIMKEILRVLKPGGHFCFQIGFGGRPRHIFSTQYFENSFDAKRTNGEHDVVVMSEQELKSDLIDRIGFVNYCADIANVGPGDCHKNWIWVQVEKAM